MSVAFRTLYGEVLRYAPEAPGVLVNDVLREAARDFFSRSHAWRETVDLTLVDGQDTYEILNTPDPDADPDPIPANVPAFYDSVNGYYHVDVVSWHEVRYADEPLKKRTAAETHRQVPTPTEIFWGFENPTKDTIRLIGTPGANEDGETLTVTISVKPSRQARSIISDEMVDLYKDAIVNGAVARLLLIPRQPWTNPNQASYHMIRFDEAILDADNRAQTQYSRHIVRKTRYGGL